MSAQFTATAATLGLSIVPVPLVTVQFWAAPPA
jgi:hypothetical protein